MNKISQIIFIFIVNSWFAHSLESNFTVPITRNRKRWLFPRFRDFTDNRRYDFKTLVSQHGYTPEEYIIKSKDGYDLCLHRISGSPSQPKAPGKKVVYMQHGLAMWAINFVLRGPGRDLAFLLVDAGYDVWMGSARGTPQSRSHTSISPRHNNFWDYTYHEIALYDISAFIDSTLRLSGQDKLVYIGYSLGTTESLVLLSLKPEYNEKVSLVIELAPVAFWKHNSGLFMSSVSKLLRTLELFNPLMNYHEVFSRIGDGVCNLARFHERIMCTQMYILLEMMVDHSRIDQKSFAALIKTYPVGLSAKTLFHLAQNMKSGELRAYDYGPSKNIKIWGSERPPKYPLGKISAPVALIYGQDDIFAKIEDVEDLKNTLPNVVASIEIPYRNFRHVDFILANDAKNLFFGDVLKLIVKYA